MRVGIIEMIAVAEPRGGGHEGGVKIVCGFVRALVRTCGRKGVVAGSGWDERVKRPTPVEAYAFPDALNPSNASIFTPSTPAPL